MLTEVQALGQALDSAGRRIDMTAAPDRHDRPLCVGLIRNPNSQRNRDRDGGGRGAVGNDIEVIEIEPRSSDDISEVVAEMYANGVSHLVVDGGDGTLRDVMTALPAAYGTRLPTLTVFAGGNANLAAADVGSGGHGPDALPALLRSLGTAGAGRRQRRRPIMVRWPDDSRQPVLGFFIGASGFYRAWKLALGPIRQRGLLHGAGIAGTLIASAWKTLARGRDNEWQAGMPMDVAIDTVTGPEGARFVFLATSLHQLFGNLWPFFDHGEKTLRWLDIDAPPPRFARALPALLRGRPKPWMRASGAYRSGGADHIELRLETPLVIDGEAYTPGAYGIVELMAGPEIEFYTPFASS